jgi:uncharacterized membrane protein
MADVTAELAKYTPYVFLVAIVIFVAYIWANRSKLKSVNAIAIAGVSAALVAVATNVIKIPTPPTGGYINFGDTMVMFTAMLFGPVIGSFAGGVGSALGDVMGGYPGWAPVTLVVKGIEGLVVGYIAMRIKGTSGLCFTNNSIAFKSSLFKCISFFSKYSFSKSIRISLFLLSLMSI